MATARKQKARGFNKFLDFIGLVESDKENEFEPEFDSRPRGRNAGRTVVMEDEFEEEPRMTRVSSRNSERSARRPSNGRFEEAEDWNTGRSRPEYGSRNSHASASKGAAYGKYNTDQGYGTSASQTRSSARYADNSFSGTGGYYSGRDRGTASARPGSYGGSSRWEDADAFQPYGASSVQPEIRPAQIGGQRHQTVIFKLRSVDECKEVILALIEKKSVLLNLDELDSLQAQRALDTMSGATFAIGATLSRASDRTWLIAPNNVEVASSQGDDGYGTGRYM